MTKTKMTFGELVETARNYGFELYDSRELPVDRELQAMLEDENLTAEPVRVEFRRAPGERKRGVVAVLGVRDQTFQLFGEWSRLWELERLVTGTPSKPGSSPLGEPPGNG